MKVLFITRLYLPHIGGVERHLAGLVKHCPANIQITILTEKYRDDLTAAADLVPTIRIPTYHSSQRQKKFVIWKWLIKNYRFITSFDVIHVHDTVFWIYPLWPLIKNKLFCTFHGWEGKYPLPVKNILQKRLDSKLVQGSIAVGDFISRWYHLKVSAVTYGAAQSSKFTPARLPENTLLFLGRLDPDTGLDDCLSFLTQHPRLNLAILGAGSLKLPSHPQINYLGVTADPTPYLHAATWVYTTGYLGILESFLARKQVYVSASNPLKRDYLLSHPMAKYLHFDHDLNAKFDTQTPYKWAAQQTFSRLWQMYLRLWQKNL